jgi:putative acetyltransferase
MPALPIIAYQPRYRADFARLNEAWITRFYQLEEEDRQFLADPEHYLLGRGGMVFFLLEGEAVAGTCGVLRLDSDTYELVRLAVDDAQRGKGYGEALVHHAAGWAKAQGAKQLILETGSVLTPAIRLYEKLGFVHYTPQPQHRSGLARADVFMQLALAPHIAT